MLIRLNNSPKQLQPSVTYVILVLAKSGHRRYIPTTCFLQHTSVASLHFLFYAINCLPRCLPLSQPGQYVSACPSSFYCWIVLLQCLEARVTATVFSHAELLWLSQNNCFGTTHRAVRNVRLAWSLAELYNGTITYCNDLTSCLVSVLRLKNRLLIARS